MGSLNATTFSLHRVVNHLLLLCLTTYNMSESDSIISVAFSDNSAHEKGMGIWSLSLEAFRVARGRAGNSEKQSNVNHFLWPQRSWLTDLCCGNVEKTTKHIPIYSLETPHNNITPSPKKTPTKVAWLVFTEKVIKNCRNKLFRHASQLFLCKVRRLGFITELKSVLECPSNFKTDT